MFVNSVADLDVEKYGKEIEHMTSIFPNTTNVTFTEFVSRDYLKIREWERGTGETIGCGTGCATAVVTAILTGKCDRKVNNCFTSIFIARSENKKNDTLKEKRKR